MRPIHWLFVLGVALFVSGIGLVISAERTARLAGPAVTVPARPAVAPVATVLQIMKGVVAPSAAVVWDSVSASWGDVVTEKRPQTDEEWDQVATSAALLVESGHLLLEGDRPVDDGDWPKMALAMAESSTKALKAAQARSVEGIFEVGEELNKTCDSCHDQYRRK